MYIKKVAMICLLVRSCEPAEDYHVVIWYLEQPASFKANPIGVFFDFQIETPAHIVGNIRKRT